MPAITIGDPNLLVNGPVLDVVFLIPQKVEEDLKAQDKQIPEGIPTKALIDTGATVCSVQDLIPKQLGLSPVGTSIVKTPNSSNHQAYEYFMKMWIPSMNLVYENIFLALPLQEQNIRALIGRDFLSAGILIYTGNASQFTLSLL